MNVASSMWLYGAHVQECSPGVSLSGAYQHGPHVLVVRESVFLYNSTIGNGAGLFTDTPWSTQIVESSVFIGNSAGNGGALSMTGVHIKEVKDCIFANNDVNSLGGLGGAIESNDELSIEGCTFWGNSQLNPVSGGAAIFGQGFRLKRNIFARNSGSPAVRATYLVTDGGCNDYWDNPNGNTIGVEPYPTDIFVDPLFCDPEIGDWTLTKGSPCLPEGSGNCGLIGALGQGCGFVSVESKSWGAIKGMYK